MRFTFKTTRERWNETSYEIKLRRKVVGEFIYSSGVWKIKFMVVKADLNTTNCRWIWTTLRHSAKTLDEAKLFVNDNIIAITSKLTLFIGEPS